MSNASEIREYYKELMSDLVEHSRTELIAYVKRQNPEANYTEGMLASALKTLIDRNEGYICVGRGKYKLNVGKDLDNEKYIKTLIRKYGEILEATIVKIETEVVVNPFFLLKEEQEKSDVVKMDQIQKCIDTIKQTIKCINGTQD